MEDEDGKVVKPIPKAEINYPLSSKVLQKSNSVSEFLKKNV